ELGAPAAGLVADGFLRLPHRLVRLALHTLHAVTHCELLPRKAKGGFSPPFANNHRSVRNGYHQARRRPPAPPAKSEMSQMRASTAATMNSQWIVKPTPNAMIASTARSTSRSMSLVHLLSGNLCR